MRRTLLVRVSIGLRLNTAALAVVSCCFLTPPAQAQQNRWNRSGPPTFVWSIAVDPVNPRIVYIGTDHGVFRSTDGGGTWVATALTSSSYVPRLPLAVDLHQPSNVYAATDSAIFKTTDRGEHWVSINTGLANDYSMLCSGAYSLDVDPVISQRLYAGCGGLFQSDDGGLSWQLISRARACCDSPDFLNHNYNIRLFALDGNGGIYAGGINIYATFDGGSTWYGPLFSGYVNLLMRDPNTSVIFAAGGSGLARNKGGIAGFENLGLNDKVVQGAGTDPRNPATIYAGTSGFGVWRSTDGGRTWSPFNEGLTNLAVTSMAVAPTTPPTIYAGTTTGVFVYWSVATCVPDATTRCLNSGRFKVGVVWSVPSQGTSGVAKAAPLTEDTGYFWFFSPNNIELVVKVVDGRAFNGKFWVFYGALSNVEYTITVTDTVTGAVKTYSNPSGQLASVADTSAF